MRSLLPDVLRGETRRTYLVDDLLLHCVLSYTMPAMTSLPARDLGELCRSLAVRRHGEEPFLAVVFYRGRGNNNPGVIALRPTVP